MRYKLHTGVEVEIIKEGEESSLPLGYINWTSGKAKENGINVVWGDRGEVGAFISEKLLKRFLKEFEKDETNDDNS